MAQNKKIVFLDETMFTTATVLTHAFSPRKTNIQIDQKLMNNEALAVIAGISSDNGFEGYLVKKNSIDSDSFIEYVQLLQEMNPGKPLAIFMDNASFHRSKKVKAYLGE